MKLKSILAILLLMAGLQTAMAQKLVLHLTGNQAVEYDISQLDSISFIEGTTEEYEYVDLGLPSGTLWATCNVGASSPEEYGDYFAWGETEPKSDYSWSTYKYCKGSFLTMTKYCTNSTYGTVDNKTELEPSDDAATVNWGSNWQMPSDEQLEELYNSSYTTTTWTTLNGKRCIKITSKSNGNSIFLPAAGYRDDTSLIDAGRYYNYWSRSLGTSFSYHACSLYFDSSNISNIDTYNGHRYYGRSVRPVRVNGVQTVAVSNIELSQTVLSVMVGETSQLSATVLPENATNKNLKWESSDTDVATVDQSGKVTSVAGGTCTITCSATDGSGVKAECKITVKNDNSGTLDGHEYVDLGLPSGTLWATCNVGANSPEEYGDYFAWGETEPKTTYDWSTYKYCKGTDDTMTKYCTDSSYGTVDNKTELEPSDDAATVNWSSDWQMPSREQYEELYNNSYTTTTWTTMNGVYGRKITSKSNGNSIFLPAAGYRSGASRSNPGSDGYYWSRSLDTNYSCYAYYLRFYSSDIYTHNYFRDDGKSVRPVRVIAVSNIELSQTELSVKVGETTQLSATVLPDNATNKNLKWESSNTDIATVDETGKVTSVAGGTCTITCSATDLSGVKAECIVTVTNPDNSGTLDGHEYVDLGLPSGTLWATCNVGANSPEEYGDYFAWGETTMKSSYNESTYKYCQGSYNTMTKYCTNSNYGTVDYKTELEPSDDAATVNWGSNWQMPSEEQLEELYNSSYTTTTWTTLNGVYGRKITSKSNGNSIFVPAAGYRGDTNLNNAGSYGNYCSRSLGTGSGCHVAYALYFNSSDIGTSYGYRFYGISVRPVRMNGVRTVDVSNIELSQTVLSVKVGETSQLSATVLPENATNKNLKWESSNADVATVDETGKVTAVAVGTCTITCSATDGSGVKAECIVTVMNPDNSGTLDGHEYVDLGLPSGTLWATCNVGANSPEEYGDYFAWGETEPKSDYSWSTYMYCKGTENTMTKYCTNSSEGAVDNKTELEPSDDAATVNWGSGWQMPSREQCVELYNSSYTTTTWTTMNGKYGRKITSKSNGNSIFLPAAGSRSGTSLNGAGSSGGYLSRSLSTSYSSSAYSLNVSSSNISTSYSCRYYGRGVRPVRVR